MKKFALIGKDVSYTVSPFVHKRLFSLKNQNASYAVLDGDADNVFMAAKTLDGYNVTKPYKEQIVPFLSSTEGEAKIFGSVNTVFKNIGYNTDVFALEKCLQKHGLTLCGSTLILGFGGLGKAVATRALALSGKVAVAVKSSSLEKAESAICQLKTRFKHAEISLFDISNIDGNFDLMINATPVGTFPHHLHSPVLPQVVNRVKAVVDCVYNPSESVLVRTAKSLGILGFGGLEMLVEQAAKAQNVWLGNSFSDEETASVVRDAETELKKFPTNVVLTGFMGAGKTEVAKKIAELTASSFFDVDQTVESYGKTIPEIFNDGGEAAFRSAERKAVLQCADSRFSIIAAGGGSVMDAGNVSALKSGGKIVFLRAPFEVLYGRIVSDTTPRPIADRLSFASLKALYEKRLPHYEKTADFTVDASGSVEEVARRIISLF